MQNYEITDIVISHEIYLLLFTGKKGKYKWFKDGSWDYP